MTAKTIYSGTTHNVGGANGYTRSADGFLDLQLSDPHPAAENFFGAAWSGCFMGAIGLAAAQKKVTLPEAPSVDATIDLVMEAGEFFLRAKLDVTVPGIDIDLARELVDHAHEICPYSKATRGNIDVQVTVLEPAFA
ncbi:MAG: Ohr family peroxiredoxin [Sphingomonas sp.]|jgi:Ohr subfamily peroxiredoxin|uniref:Ohr family peroxiredoxin n=1 Tax=Sphingomonas sp. TaxID=28214 RepID=UPI00356307C9